MKNSGQASLELVLSIIFLTPLFGGVGAFLLHQWRQTICAKEVFLRARMNLEQTSPQEARWVRSTKHCHGVKHEVRLLNFEP